MDTRLFNKALALTLKSNFPELGTDESMEGSEVVETLGRVYENAVNGTTDIPDDNRQIVRRSQFELFQELEIACREMERAQGDGAKLILFRADVLPLLDKLHVERGGKRKACQYCEGKDGCTPDCIRFGRI